MQNTRTTQREGILVVQHNDFINARFALTNTELRIFVAMLSRLKKGDMEFPVFQVPVSEIMDVKKGGSCYRQIKEAADGLCTKKVATELKRGNKMEYDGRPLMAQCRYVEGNGYLEAEFNKRVEPLLLQLKGDFTPTQLEQLLKLKTFNSYRIYWLLKQYETWDDHRIIALDDLKHMLMLEDGYPVYQNFRKRVLEGARRELANTDMPFTYEEIRIGRSVQKIRFDFIGKAVPLEITKPVMVVTDWSKALLDVGVSKESLIAINALVQEKAIEVDYIKFCISYYKHKQSLNQIKKNLPGAIFVGIITKQLYDTYTKDKSKRKPTIPVVTRKEMVSSPESVHIWNAAMLYIREKVPKHSVDTWFEPIVPVSYENEVLVLMVQTMFVYECIEKDYTEVLREALQGVGGKGIKLEYTLPQ